MELTERVFAILGRSRGARLIVLALFLITSGGVGLTIADSLKINSSIPAIFLVLGILAFLYGLDVYSTESKDLSVNTTRRKDRKSRT